MNQFEKTIYKSLLKKYPEPEWIVLNQVRTHTGATTNYGGERYIDFFIMNMYPSKNHLCIAIEAKQDIVDLMNDFKDSTKQVAARFYADHFYYLITQELFESNQKMLNKEFFASKRTDGLLIYRSDTESIRIHYRNFKQEKSPFSFGFVASLLRNAYKRS